MTEPKRIRLIGLRCHITPLQRKRENKSPSGLLHTPFGYDDDLKQWLVLGVGPGKWCRKKKGGFVFIAPEVSAGERVLCDTSLGGVALPDGTWIVDARQCAMKW